MAHLTVLLPSASVPVPRQRPVPKEFLAYVVRLDSARMGALSEWLRSRPRKRGFKCGEATHEVLADQLVFLAMHIPIDRRYQIM